MIVFVVEGPLHGQKSTLVPGVRLGFRESDLVLLLMTEILHDLMHKPEE